MDSTVTIAALGIVATVCGSLIWIVKYLFTSFKPILDDLVVATRDNTNVTRNADKYLRDRNGRDQEFHCEVMVALKDIPIQQAQQNEIVAKELKRVGDITAAKLKHVGSQEIKEQHVEHQTINESTK